jgi:hypothetical protein
LKSNNGEAKSVWSGQFWSRSQQRRAIRAGSITQAERDEVPEYQIQHVAGRRSVQVLRGYIRDAGSGQVKAIRTVLDSKDKD